MKNIKTVNINFRPSSSVRPNLTSTRAGGKSSFWISTHPRRRKPMVKIPVMKVVEDVGGGSGGGSGEAPDPAA